MPISNQVVRYALAADPEVQDADTRTIRFVLSDSSVARDGHTLATSGWDISSYQKNPVVLFGHDAGHVNSVIGRMSSITTRGDQLVGDVEFMPGDVNPAAETVYQMVRQGYLNAVSVGFIPQDGVPARGRGPGAYDFSKQELLEVSVVPVPALPTALAEARAAGIDTAPIVAWAKRIMETSAMANINRAAADWKCAAATDLPTSSVETWDGPAAAKAILDAAAGSDGVIDADKAKRGFLIYDAGNPGERGSYKEPFASLIDGTLTVTKGGVQAAASRLPQVDGASDEVKASARAILDHYEEKLGMGAGGSGDRATPLVLRRDLYNVSALAYLLMELAWLQEWVEWEEAQEGDGSDMPDRIAAAMKVLGQILVDMTAEEVSELVGAGGVEQEVEQDEDQGAIDRLAQGLKRSLFAVLRHGTGQIVTRVNAKALKRMDIGSIAAALRAGLLTADAHRALADVIETRAGRVLSSDNETTLRGAHDRMTEACDMVRSVVDQVGGEDIGEDDGGDDTGAGERSRRARALRHTVTS